VLPLFASTQIYIANMQPEIALLPEFNPFGH
jgi:hypothetical protein